jgi:imidazolonepropionase-like amidohydrolase
MSGYRVQCVLPKGAIFCVAAVCVAWPAYPAEILPAGFRPRPPGSHALTGAKVVTKPGEAPDGATILIRDGFIKAVGKDLALPADAHVWDMKGLTIYAGFIDPYLVLSQSNAPVSTADTEPVAEDVLTGGGVNFYGTTGQRTDRGGTGAGYENARVTPERRALQTYSPREKSLAPLRELGFTAGVVAPASGIIRGTSAQVALVEDNPNTVTLKPDVFQHVAFETRGDEERAYPSSLMGVIAVVRQAFLDAGHYTQDHADYAKRPNARPRPEFNPALEALALAADDKQRVLFEPGSALMVSRANQIARELVVDFALVSCGQEWRRPDLLPDVNATFIVPLNFPTLPKLPSEDDWEQVALDQLRAWDWAAENPAVLRQQGREIALTTYGLADKKGFRKNLRLALDRGLSEADALAALTTVPAKLCGVESQLGTIEVGKIANLTIVDGKGYFDPEAKVRQVWIDGRVYRTPADEPKAAAAAASDASSAQTAPTAVEPEKSAKEKKQAELKELQRKRVARSPLEGRGPIVEPAALLIQNATVWTCGEQGVLTNAQVLIKNGKVEAVGTFSTAAGADVVRFDAQGRHVTPGLIDAHSHTAILGAVNESSIPSSAMCRIGDVVNSETKNLFEQLAGGLTMCNLYHGSANPIGGQDCIIKLRDGASPDGLKFDAAPPGLKMALGENVKQSNWGDRMTTRFPQSRMGVRTFIANRYTAAREYLAQIEAAKKSGRLPPRRDLELEALGEVLQAKRWVHCHAYRQDEIIAFLRLMEGFGVKVASLEHALEGYKVADELAAHGVGPSCFADWWAYKFEVYDAIPYAGSLMRERGALVSFNSDSSDLARRMYLEAAKAVKFGGMPEVEALKFITINPAKQLKIDARVGSLEPGKDADFAIWSKPPLDSGTVCLQTWIDGKKYFDRDQAATRAADLEKERAALIAKAKKMAKLGGGGGGGGGGEKDDGSFFRVALEKQFETVDREEEAEGL